MVRQEIESWFATYGQAGVVLPDGWLDKPFDTTYTLDGIQGGVDGWQLTLGERLLLRFNGDVRATRRGHDLILDGFEELIVVGAPPDRGQFRSGSVELRAFMLDGKPVKIWREWFRWRWP